MAGSFSSELASVRISSENVAEKSSVCRCRGSSANTRFMSGRKPMSSMRSASSSTSTSTCDRSMVFWPAWSSSRPGVATTMSTPRFSAAIWLLIDTPPKTTATVDFLYLP